MYASGGSGGSHHEHGIVMALHARPLLISKFAMASVGDIAATIHHDERPPVKWPPSANVGIGGCASPQPSQLVSTLGCDLRRFCSDRRNPASRVWLRTGLTIGRVLQRVQLIARNTFCELLSACLARMPIGWTNDTGW